MRSSRAVNDWPRVWVAGFTSHREGQNYLFYLIQVERAFESFRELWEAHILSESTKQAKNASRDSLGDILNGDTEGRRIGRKRKRWTDLVLVKGGRGSRLLKRAKRISADEKAKDKGEHPVFVLDPKMRMHFGSFTELNAIQRSIPRWVEPAFRDKAAAFVRSLR